MRDDIFTKTYLNKIIYESMISGRDIPRPQRLKTPPNYYGNTGHNAKYYNCYVQDEACSIFQDKYGRERGQRLWEGIIDKGNAMWTACDEILGQQRTMEDIVEGYLKNIDTQGEPRIPDSWIILWVYWLLIEVIEGKRKLTKDYISECIPTFKAVREQYPIIMGILLQRAGIDIDNYQLSKKIQAKVDAKKAEEQRIRLEQEQKKRKEEEQRIRREQEQQSKDALKKQLQEEYKQLVNENYPNTNKYSFPNFISDDQYVGFDKWYKRLDWSKGLKNFINLPVPLNKDEMRIYDIVKKSNRGRTSLDGIDIRKAYNLAYDMNSKITDETKRQRRKQAALKYGLLFLAKEFVR